jgi:myotubularin-related protein 3/4
VVQTTDGILVVSNYRLYVQAQNTHSNIPLGLIDQLEIRDIFFLHIHCKDARTIRCTFPNNETVTEVMRRVQTALGSPKRIEDFFAFAFNEKVDRELPSEMRTTLGLVQDRTTARTRFYNEIKRMEFNVENPWRVSEENEDYELCSSYPKLIIVPNSIDKKKLEQVACFRSARRFPAVVWR